MVLFRRVLGDVLRRERMLQGLTLREVSATARVSLGYISEIERGQKEASSELLSSLCGALDTPLSDVLREVSDAVAVEEARLAIGTTPLARRPAQRRRRRRLRRLIRPRGRTAGRSAGAQAHPLPKHLPIRYQVLWTSRLGAGLGWPRLPQPPSLCVPKGSPCAPAPCTVIASSISLHEADRHHRARPGRRHACGRLLRSASANPGGTALVISEVYGGGGNAGATYTHDYVELYNPTAAPISLATMSIQYRSTASTVAPAAGGVTSLATAGSVPAGDYFVVQLASQAAVGVAVPNVDFVGNSSTNLSGSNGQVYLANSTTAIDPDGAGDTTITDPAVIDFVGYGTAAIKEGATAAPSPAGNAASITRDEDDTDTDVNGADFASSDPTPGAGFAPPPPPEEFTGTIAEIQGTDADVSPHVGDIATTTGVVTAKFPLVDPKGFNGFYLQTGGTGGATDATPGASDAVFVFTPSYDETNLGPRLDGHRHRRGLGVLRSDRDHARPASPRPRRPSRPSRPGPLPTRPPPRPARRTRVS